MIRTTLVEIRSHSEQASNRERGSRARPVKHVARWSSFVEPIEFGMELGARWKVGVEFWIARD